MVEPKWVYVEEDATKAGKKWKAVDTNVSLVDEPWHKAQKTQHIEDVDMEDTHHELGVQDDIEEGGRSARDNGAEACITDTACADKAGRLTAVGDTG